MADLVLKVSKADYQKALDELQNNLGKLLEVHNSLTGAKNELEKVFVGTVGDKLIEWVVKNLKETENQIERVKNQIQKIRNVAAPKDKVAPEGFYSSSNHTTHIFYKGEWIIVENIEMSYEADTMLTKIDSYASANISNPSLNGTLVATHDGNGTVIIGLG